MNFLYILFLMLMEVLRPNEIHGLALNLTNEINTRGTVTLSVRIKS